MPNPGSIQLTAELTVTWIYDEDSQQLTVTEVIKGTPVASAVLKPTANTASRSGSSGGTSATVDLVATFATRVLQITYAQQNPNRNGTNNANF